MKRTSIHALCDLGQSVWLDNISRSLIGSGRLAQMIQQGLRGMTSNPTIFDKAISHGSDYDEKISELSKQSAKVFDIYDELTVQDIQAAADAFCGVYQESEGLDGYVSLEINPTLAYQTQETIKEGRRLFQKVNRPNVMLKVPATQEGFGAIEEFVASGMNVNITLIFSLQQYVAGAQSYLRGIKRLLASGVSAKGVRSVASVFVSRIDSMIDASLDEIIGKEQALGTRKAAMDLKGKAAVANSKLIYRRYREIFLSPEFRQLQTKGVNIQRVLWGSTSTKNPLYSDIKYVSELIGKDTVNTMPDETFAAFLDHGKVNDMLTQDVASCEEVLAQLSNLGIDINDVCARLLTNGVSAFEKSFLSLLNTIKNRQEKLCPKC